MGGVAMQMPFVDAHLHLQDPRFKGKVNEVIGRSKIACVGLFFCNAIKEEDWPEVTALAAVHREIIPFLGIHPWFSDTAASGWQHRLMAAAETLDRTFGIGETGLDRSCRIDFDIQRRLFAEHLELAAARNWPLSVHCVRAWGALADMLSTFSLCQPLPPVLIHSFNGSTEMMRRLTELGCYISYSEALAQQQTKLHQTFTQTPSEYLLLETDAPYAKNPDRKKGPNQDTVNEPSDMVELYRHAARLLQVDTDELVTRIWNNATIFTNQNAAGC